MGPATNLKINATVASNILTVALKTQAGADPSAGDPVNFFFETSGQVVGPVSLTSALSLSTVVGATMGAFNASVVRIWLVVFNDAGTLRIGMIQAVQQSALGSVTQIFSVPAFGIASSTAMSSGSTSPGVFYTGVAVTAKAYQIIGYLEFPSLATAGSYSSAPSKIQLWGPGVPIPGQPVKHGFINNAGTTSTTSTSLVDAAGTSLQMGVSTYNPVKVSYAFMSSFGLVASANVLHSFVVCDASNSGWSGTFQNSVGSSSGGLQMGSPCAISFCAFPQLAFPLFKLRHQVNNASSTGSLYNINCHMEEIMG